MVIGFRTQLASACTAVCLAVIYFHYGHGEGHEPWTAHHIYLLLIASALIAFTPSGRSYSLDRWIVLQRQTSAQALPERGNLTGLRLISLQIVLIYFWAGFDKLKPTFLSGERMQHFLYDFYAGVEFGAIPGFAMLCTALALLTVMLEFGLAFGLLVPRFQKALIPIGILFHLIIYMVFPVLTFSLTMVLLYLSFVPADRVHSIIDRLNGYRVAARP